MASLSPVVSTLVRPTIKVVQMDSLVVMKIIKHVDSELHAGMSETAGEACQGLLTGLVCLDEERLEVTNSFPTPRAEPVADADEVGGAMDSAMTVVNENELMNTLKKFRQMNIDYELVGFYQAHAFGACFNQDVAESMHVYQEHGPDGILIVYDPVKTRMGQLSLKAYRLTFDALKLCAQDNWSPEAVRAAGLTYENTFEELPISIKSSHLVNVMMAELALTPSRTPITGSGYLKLGTGRSLEKCIRGIMTNVDELNKSITAISKYMGDKQRHENHIASLTQKRQIENELRQSRGEPPLLMDDIKKLKLPVLQARSGMLDSFLQCREIDALHDFCRSVTGENVAKILLAESVAEEKLLGKDRKLSTSTILSRFDEAVKEEQTELLLTKKKDK